MFKAYLVPHPPLIVPGVGSGDEIQDTRRAFGQIAAEAAEYAPDAVVIVTPHNVSYADYFHISPGKSAKGDFGAFRAGNVKISALYDEELARRIAEEAGEAGIPAGPLGEKNPALDHGVMVPLYFLRSPVIVRISLSGLPPMEHYRFGMCVRRAAESLSRRILLIASGDMSHKLKADGPYGFAKEGPAFDAFARECAETADFRRLLAADPDMCENAGECGLRSFVILAGAMDGLKTESRVLSYEGPFGVGYLTAAFTGEKEAPSLLARLWADRRDAMESVREKEDAYVRLARQNAEHFVKTGRSIAVPKGLPPDMTDRQAGVFVSIKKSGALRGCIGTIAPTCGNIAEEILANSVSAAAKDPRFDPITPGELDELTYSVDVLSPPEPAEGPETLDAARYGVIVSSGRKRGLLLPNLAGVDTVAEQIAIARRKGGIGEREPYTLERFEVVRHGG